MVKLVRSCFIASQALACMHSSPQLEPVREPMRNRRTICLKRPGRSREMGFAIFRAMMIAFAQQTMDVSCIINRRK